MAGVKKLTNVSPQDNVLATKEDVARFKSIFYVLNGRQDTEVKLLRKRKKITLADILDLNNKVTEKLKNHKVLITITQITVSYLIKED